MRRLLRNGLFSTILLFNSTGIFSGSVYSQNDQGISNIESTREADNKDVLKKCGFQFFKGLPVVGGQKYPLQNRFFKTTSLGDNVALDRWYVLYQLKQNDKYFDRFEDRQERIKMINRFTSLKNRPRYMAGFNRSDLVAEKSWGGFVKEVGEQMRDCSKSMTLPMDFVVLQIVYLKEYDREKGGYPLGLEDTRIQFSFRKISKNTDLEFSEPSELSLPALWPIGVEKAVEFEEQYGAGQRLVLLHHVTIKKVEQSNLSPETNLQKNNRNSDKQDTLKIYPKINRTVLYLPGIGPSELKNQKGLWPGKFLHAFKY